MDLLLNSVLNVNVTLREFKEEKTDVHPSALVSYMTRVGHYDMTK